MISTCALGLYNLETEMLRWIAMLVAGAVGLVGVLDAAAEPARRAITQADTGKTFHVARGHSVTLRLANRWAWSTPRASSKAIELSPVEYFVDPGFREWRIAGRARGTATIRATGKPNCTSCTLSVRRFRVTITVGGAS